MSSETRGRIIVFEEKHGNRLFLADTEERLHAAALKILRERMEEGWIEVPEPPDKTPETLLTEEQFMALSAFQRDRVAKRRAEYEAGLKEYEREIVSYARTQKTLFSNDGALAFRVITERKDYEYEGWDFEFLEEA